MSKLSKYPYAQMANPSYYIGSHFICQNIIKAIIEYHKPEIPSTPTRSNGSTFSCLRSYSSTIFWIGQNMKYHSTIVNPNNVVPSVILPELTAIPIMPHPITIANPPAHLLCVYYDFKRNFPNSIADMIEIPPKLPQILGITNIYPIVNIVVKVKSIKEGIHINHKVLLDKLLAGGYIIAFIEYAINHNDIPRNISIVNTTGCIKCSKYGIFNGFGITSWNIALSYILLQVTDNQ